MLQLLVPPALRRHPFAVLAVALAVNVGALAGLYSAAPTYQATTSIEITAAAAGPGATPGVDPNQVADDVVDSLTASGAVAPTTDSGVTLERRTLDGTQVLVATATGATEGAAETRAQDVATLAQTQARSASPGVSATTTTNPTTSTNTISAGRILTFAGVAGLAALLLAALTASASRRPAEPVVAAMEPESAPRSTGPTPAVRPVRPVPAPMPRDHVKAVDMPEEPPARQAPPTPARPPAAQTEPKQPQPKKPQRAEKPQRSEKPAQPSKPARLSRSAARKRAATIRQLVQEDWVRSGSNVAWTSQETKAAFERAERRLADMERNETSSNAAKTDWTDVHPDDWEQWGVGG